MRFYTADNNESGICDMKNTVVLGMVGAGRAAEIHLQALEYIQSVRVRKKTIMAGHSETAKKGQVKYGFEQTADAIEDILKDQEIDVIDICSPPYTHEEYVIRALEAGKYVICERPLTAYFGKEEDALPIGKTVEKRAMYEHVISSLNKLADVVARHPGKFMYAENYIYAPSIQKAGEIIRKKGSKILCMKGEESLKGSSSRLAGEWSKTGGGTFTRTGSHPLSAILWLKSVEAQTAGKDIFVKSVIADMAQITPRLNSYDHRHIAAHPNDVEDFGTAILTFSDDTKGIVIATDTLLGGSKNYVEMYCNDATIYCTLTMNNSLSTYFLDEDHLDDVYISEMLPIKTGWNNPFLVDEIMRGYVNEMKDFMECIVFGREPLSNFQLAYDTAKITYATYVSGQTGERINLM